MGEKIEKKNEKVIENQFDASVPTKISVWTKIKNFLMQEITLNFSPKQEEILNSVSEFWHQEIDENKVKTFLFQKIKF